MQKIIILAGGLGTRVQEKYRGIPKCLIPIAGKPFIIRQLELLNKAGFREVIISLNHLGKMVFDYLKKENLDLKIKFIYDGKIQLGTGGAVKNIILKEELNQPFFIIYGDSYLPIKFSKLFRHVSNNNIRNLMCIYRNLSSEHKNNVVLGLKNKIDLYDKNITKSTMKYIDYGLNLIDPKLFLELYGNIKGKFDLSDFHHAVSLQGKLDAFEVTERFYEIGSYDGIKDLENFFINSK